jgi:hypothetical protein
MRVEMTYPDWSPESGLRIEWEPQAEIGVAVQEGEVVLRANRDGLVTLARLLLSLTQDGLFDGYHVHLDSDGALDEGSAPLIIELRSS